MPQCAEPPQHGGDQPARQSTVAVGERRKAGMALELFVERAAAAQHALDDFRRNPARGEAGHLAAGWLVLALFMRQQSHRWRAESS